MSRNRVLALLLITAVLAIALAYQFRTAVTLDMAQAQRDYLVRGFYAPEQAGGKSFRWTDGNAEIWLPGLGSGAPLRLQLAAHEFRPAPLGSNAITVTLNGRAVAHLTPGAELSTLSLDLPASQDRRGDVRIGLVSDTFSPKLAMASTDERDLGIYVNQIRLSLGPGFIFPPLWTWAWLIAGVLAVYGIGEITSRRTVLAAILGLVALAIEVAGILYARVWVGYYGPWLGLAGLCVWLAAARALHPGSTGVSTPARAIPASGVRAWILPLLGILICWRVALAIVPLAGADVASVRECCPPVEPAPVTSAWQSAFDRWYRWDALWYGSIAEHGYQYAGTREASNVAFFPLYPLVAGLLAWATGWPVAVAGSLVSTALAFVACLLLYRLTRDETGDAGAAERAAVYLLAFPVAFYLAIVYSESAYLVCVLAAFMLARQGRWGWSGLAAMLAGLSRLHGALLIAPLAFEYFRQIGFNPRRVRLDVLTLLGGPLGVAIFAAYLGLRFGHPLAYFEVQALFFRGIRAGAFPASPLLTLFNYIRALVSSLPGTETFIEGGSLVLALVLTLESWVRLPRVYGIYMLTFVLFSLVSGDLISLPRFVLPMFPAFMALGIIGRRTWVDRAILIAFALLQGVLAIMFVNGYWIA